MFGLRVFRQDRSVVDEQGRDGQKGDKCEMTFTPQNYCALFPCRNFS
jgi:hypothetical protein